MKVNKRSPIDIAWPSVGLPVVRVPTLNSLHGRPLPVGVAADRAVRPGLVGEE